MQSYTCRVCCIHVLNDFEWVCRKLRWNWIDKTILHYTYCMSNRQEDIQFLHFNLNGVEFIIIWSCRYYDIYLNIVKMWCLCTNVRMNDWIDWDPFLASSYLTSARLHRPRQCFPCMSYREPHLISITISSCPVVSISTFNI